MGLYIPKQPPVEIAVSGSSFVQVTSCIKRNNYRKDTDCGAQAVVGYADLFPHHHLSCNWCCVCPDLTRWRESLWSSPFQAHKRLWLTVCQWRELRWEAFAQQGQRKNMKTVAWGQTHFVCGFGWAEVLSASNPATAESPLWMDESPAWVQGAWCLHLQQTWHWMREWKQSSDKFSS